MNKRDGDFYVDVEAKLEKAVRRLIADPGDGETRDFRITDLVYAIYTCSRDRNARVIEQYLAEPLTSN